MKVMKLIPIFAAVAVALAALAPGRAADFFGVPEKTVVPKPPATTPAPATPTPATPSPASVPGGAARPSGAGAPAAIVGGPVNEEPPTLLPDGMQLKTPAIGGQRDWGKPYRDIGPENGVLIGFEYTVGTTEQGWTVIESFTPLYLRAAGKARGVLRGSPTPGNPATVLEARPGFAVAGMDVRGGSCLDAFRITFMRYENGVLDPSERYQTKWIGGEKGEVAKTLRTDTRPIVGVYGKAGEHINEFGLLVRKEAALVAAAPATTTFFGTPVNPGSGDPAPTITEPVDTAASELEPAVFDSTLLKTARVIGGKKNWGEDYKDLAPPGGLLVGFDVTAGSVGKLSNIIRSLQPLYLLPNGAKKLGSVQGSPTADAATRVDARPGYAVGAIQANGAAAVDGFRVVFMRINGQTLDSGDSYEGPWIGGSKGTPTLVASGGKPIVGVFGREGNEIDSIGFFVKKDANNAVAVATVRPGAVTVPATPAPIAPAGGGGVEVFACADDEFTLFHNGRQILSGSNLRHVENGSFPIVKGDVLAAVVTDKGGGGGEAWFSLRVVRDGKTVLDAGDMRYLLSEPPSWKASKMMTGFREPKVWTHDKKMGADARPRAAWAGAKDANATTLYFKGIVP